MTWRRTVAVSVAATVALTVTACGDGTPSFCAPLEANSDLSALSAALEEGDLETAGAEARRLRDLADEAPEQIRADFRALAEAVVDIVELLEEDRLASEPVEDGGTHGSSTTVDPGQVERRREELNTRFGDLDGRSERITTWARRECGLELT